MRFPLTARPPQGHARVSVLGTSSFGVRGEVPITPDTSPSVWILDDSDYDKQLHWSRRSVNLPQRVCKQVACGVVFVERTTNVNSPSVGGPDKVRLTCCTCRAALWICSVSRFSRTLISSPRKPRGHRIDSTPRDSTRPISVRRIRALAAPSAAVAKWDARCVNPEVPRSTAAACGPPSRRGVQAGYLR